MDRESRTGAQEIANGAEYGFIRHHPESAHPFIGEIMHEAHRRWEIPAEETVRTLRTAVSMDGKMGDEGRKTFFALLAPPTKTAWLIRSERTAGARNQCKWFRTPAHECSQQPSGLMPDRYLRAVPACMACSGPRHRHSVVPFYP
ncbi:hypothetical protein ACWGET_27590 [Streptomyces zaomyceticus]